MASCLRSLRRALVASYLEDWETHPQEKNHSTRDDDGHVEVKEAMT